MAEVILQADARHIPLADNSVQCVVTSPPYWGLRDYGVKGQLGLEKTPEEYVAKMVAVFREVRRVLRDDGTLWINLGDSYAQSEIRNRNGENESFYRPCRDAVAQTGKRLSHGLKPKDLVGIPWRLAFALQADGWWLRSDIIWAKPNPMPESVTDRPTKSHEYIFLLTKREKYYFDQEAVRERFDSADEHAKRSTLYEAHGNGETSRGRGNGHNMLGDPTAGRNLRSVWSIATQAYPMAHFATFPEEIPKRCILAGTSARGCCAKCGAPWERVVEKERTFQSGSGRSGNMPIGKNGASLQGGGATLDIRRGPCVESTTLGFCPTCSCNAPTRPCLVLDPFAGSGTTVAVAESLGRRGIGLELKWDYLQLAKRRCQVTLGLPL